MLNANFANAPLIDRLGIKAGMRIALLNVPDDYQMRLNVPDDVTVSYLVTIPSVSDDTMKLFDLILLFSTSRADLYARFPALLEVLAPSGTIWTAWPKRAARLTTDLDEATIRQCALDHGIVDVKTVALDRSWGAVKIVRRLKDR